MQVRPSRYWIETVWNGFGLLQYLVSSMKRFETISDYIVIIITIINIYIYTHLVAHPTFPPSILYIPMDPSIFLGSVSGMIWGGVLYLFRQCVDP